MDFGSKTERLWVAFDATLKMRGASHFAELEGVGSKQPEKPQTESRPALCYGSLVYASPESSVPAWKVQLRKCSYMSESKPFAGSHTGRSRPRIGCDLKMSLEAEVVRCRMFLELRRLSGLTNSNGRRLSH